MQLVEVKDKQTHRKFLELPKKIYKDDKRWIQHLDKDIEQVFDKNSNPSFAHGEAVRYILLNQTGETIGRVAAFINQKALENMEFPVGGMGFFECIDDEKAAFTLFDACKNWLESRSMKGMDGPINFGERDRFWGLLIESNEPPTYQEAYNPLYYRKFFELYGFKVYFEQHTYGMNKTTFTPERIGKVAERIASKQGYRFEHLRMNELEKFAADFQHIYNAAWQKFENFKPVTTEEILKIFKSMAPIVVPEFIWFAYVNNEPAGFIVMVPDVNQLFKHVNGKLNLLGKLKFMYYKLTQPMTRVKGMVFGIHPNYHNLGLDAVLVYRFYQEAMKKPQYQSAEIAWVGDFNPKMESLMQALNGSVVKYHITYRKLFDENLEFKPFSLGNYKKSEN